MVEVTITFGRKRLKVCVHSDAFAERIVRAIHPWGKQARRLGNGFWTTTGIPVATIIPVKLYAPTNDEDSERQKMRAMIAGWAGFDVEDGDTQRVVVARVGM